MNLPIRFLFLSFSILQVLASDPTGINNRGSTNCANGSMEQIQKFINTIPDTQVYKDGEHIACSSIHGGLGGGTCAFLQGTKTGATGYELKILINALAAHENTKGCGSVPVTFPSEFGGVNRLSTEGMLTVNYVVSTANPCPPGVCGSACK
jgi:Kp4